MGKNIPCLPVNELCQPVVDRAKRSDKLPWPGLMAMSVIPIGVAGYIFLYHSLFQSAKNRSHYVFHQGVLIFQKATQNSVEFEIAFWYFVGKRDLDLEFVHRTTPQFWIISFEACSPFLVFYVNSFTSLWDKLYFYPVRSARPAVPDGPCPPAWACFLGDCHQHPGRYFCFCLSVSSCERAALFFRHP